MLYAIVAKGFSLAWVSHHPTGACEFLVCGPIEYTIEGNRGGNRIHLSYWFWYLSIITPSISIQSTEFHTTQTYTPSNDGCFHKLSLFLQKYMNYLASSH